jgi:ATP-dependent DNA helicase RecG
VIEGEIALVDVAFGRRRSLLVKLQDGTGTATLRFFHFSNAQKAALRPGQVCAASAACAGAAASRRS